MNKGAMCGVQVQFNRMVREVFTDNARFQPRLVGAEGTRRYLESECVMPREQKLLVHNGSGLARLRTARMLAWWHGVMDRDAR